MQELAPVYYFANTVVRFICTAFLAVAIFSPKAGLFLKAMAGVFASLAFARGIFIYRATAGLQSTEPLMLTATRIGMIGCAAMAVLVMFRKFD